MKKIETFLSNLTHAQGLILAFLISLIFNAIFWIVNGGIYPVFPKILLALIPFLLLTIILYLIIGVGFISPREDEEKFNKEFTTAKKEVLAEYNLTSESYTEVKFVFEKLLADENEYLTDVILPLLSNSNFTFFAKLINDEDGYIDNAIELIVKDINDNLIHTITITNFIYFRKYFQKLS